MDNILHSFRIDANGAAVELDPVDALKLNPRTGFVWLHIDAKSAETRRCLSEDLGMDKVAVRTLLADDSRPRTFVHDDDILINLRGVNLNPGSRPEDMIRIRFIIQKHRVISVQPRALKATADMVECLRTQPVAPSPGGFIARYALAIAERMNPTIAVLNKQVDELETLIDSGKMDHNGETLAELRRRAIILRRYMAPQKDALMSLSMQTVSWISEMDRLRIREAADQATRVAEELEAIRERCAVVKDQITDQRAETMNRNMMLLSVVAAIFLPLSLVSGMMGINVGGMPWLEDGMGFWYVVLIIGGIGIIQVIIFRLMKWL